MIFGVMRSQPVYSERMGRSDRGEGLAVNSEVNTMWYLPFSVTLTMKKTRSSWLLSLRVNFIK
ncbi:hypothetical protein B5P45_23370 [Phyllobacterium zundukense]|uniref:Uncharacterized protein n=1 Tax=Phyllobacterium zundukense TaxID=1867719 RepID=A0A2N9VR79_9HYPH|nr:hypothetical protein BLM14_12920 [Phyllobacterium zundukense]PIO41997.1 hypothetical protein B5P45_23370 [Phyllobacterium zundukense]